MGRAQRRVCPSCPRVDEDGDSSCRNAEVYARKEASVASPTRWVSFLFLNFMPGSLIKLCEAWGELAWVLPLSRSNDLLGVRGASRLVGQRAQEHQLIVDTLEAGNLGLLFVFHLSKVDLVKMVGKEGSDVLGVWLEKQRAQVDGRRRRNLGRAHG